MHGRTSMTVAVTALVAMAIAGNRAEACMVCIPLPETTLADALVDADAVVLARENPDKPYSFIAVDVLKGEISDPAIDVFLNSQTRRRLGMEPDRAVVLILGRTEARPGSTRSSEPSIQDEVASSSWRSAGYATVAYESIVREILANAPRWRGQPGARRRALFFMPYLAHEERPIQELAYLEVGMSSYDTIRMADSYVSADQIQAFLGDRLYFEWRALFILLLGFDATPPEQAAIRAQMETNARLNSTANLSAWAAALIEVDGEQGLEWLEANYLGNAGRDPGAVTEVLKAMSVHGNRELPLLRPRIVEGYGVLIGAHPSLAGWTARDLTAWRSWRFAGELEDLRQSQVSLDRASEYAIDSYLRRARSRGSNSPPPSQARKASTGGINE